MKILFEIFVIVNANYFPTHPMLLSCIALHYYKSPGLIIVHSVCIHIISVFLRYCDDFKEEALLFRIPFKITVSGIIFSFSICFSNSLAEISPISYVG